VSGPEPGPELGPNPGAVRGSMPGSVPGIIELTEVRGRAAAEADRLDLVIEVPHGATATIDFTSLAAQLTSTLPDGLVDFFHVNTDAGAPELALAAALALVAAEPDRRVAIARCRVPRTFIDCNRRIDATAAELRAGKVTPGLMPWITTVEDRELLRAAYERYVATVAGLTARLRPDGAMLLLHTYAPRTVDVQVDLQIVESLRRAYQPEIEPTWPLRPEVDVIGRDPDGVDHSPPAVVAALRAELAALGLTLADGATYPLHSSTLAWGHVMAHPGRALCVEVRRDLVADPFEPFAQMKMGEAKVERLGRALAAAMRAWWR
jgi:N-formylglutamate amidohydrolase